MKRRLILAMMAAAVLTTVSATAADKEVRKERREDRQEQRQENRADRVDFDRHVDRINALDNRPVALRVGMAEVSKQTAIPLPTIEAQHKAHPRFGLAALFRSAA